MNKKEEEANDALACVEAFMNLLGCLCLAGAGIVGIIMLICYILSQANQ